MIAENHATVAGETHSADAVWAYAASLGEADLHACWVAIVMHALACGATMRQVSGMLRMVRERYAEFGVPDSAPEDGPLSAARLEGIAAESAEDAAESAARLERRWRAEGAAKMEKGEAALDPEVREMIDQRQRELASARRERVRRDVHAGAVLGMHELRQHHLPGGTRVFDAMVRWLWGRGQRGSAVWERGGSMTRPLSSEPR